jgi:hypothetical protein
LDYSRLVISISEIVHLIAAFTYDREQLIRDVGDDDAAVGTVLGANATVRQTMLRNNITN